SFSIISVAWCWSGSARNQRDNGGRFSHRNILFAHLVVSFAGNQAMPGQETQGESGRWTIALIIQGERSYRAGTGSRFTLISKRINYKMSAQAGIDMIHFD